MVATLLSAGASSPELAELLRPERLPNGTEPEERIILCGLSWQRYLALQSWISPCWTGVQVSAHGSKPVASSGRG